MDILSSMQVKVTRNYQVTIPAEIRRKLGIKIGDILLVRCEDGVIIMEKPKLDLPTFKLGREVTTRDIERAVEEALEEDEYI